MVYLETEVLIRNHSNRSYNQIENVIQGTFTIAQCYS
jgi:hypothetical protein